MGGRDTDIRTQRDIQRGRETQRETHTEKVNNIKTSECAFNGLLSPFVVFKGMLKQTITALPTIVIQIITFV